MENTKSFFFYSFAFSTGLLIYTFVLYMGYYLFMSEDKNKENNNDISSVVSTENKETINDLNEVDFLEDIDEENV